MPHLKKEPVGILSNNDGCLVALSPELKQLGITRGTPGFKIKDMVNKKKVYLFSSNYELYGDMSSRVMRILSSMADDIEIYSIDEAFLSFKGFSDSFDLFKYAKEIQNKVERETSIPVSVGLGRTKTIAKIATHIAKKSATNVFELLDETKVINVLKSLNIEDVWGIGRQYTKRLNRFGIYTAEDFIKAPAYLIRKEMGVMGERTQLELKGVSCSDLEMTAPPTKSIVCSRSFGKSVSNLDEMLESISLYSSMAIKNLREKGLVAKNLTVFITTNPFKETKQYANFSQGSLADYSAYTPDFIALGSNLLKRIYKEGFFYKKTGVMLTDITKQDKLYPNLFTASYGDDKRHLVMGALDKINHKYGKDKIFFASCGTKKDWQMKREFATQRYTTRWNELMRVKG